MIAVMRFSLASISVVVGIVSFTACVGSNPSSGGPGVGESGGECFADNKCKEGLFCRLPERICLSREEALADGGTIATEDSGTNASDAGTSSGNDGGGDAAASSDGGAGCQISSGTGMPCVSGSPCSAICCGDKTTLECGFSCTTHAFECDNGPACGTNQACCATTGTTRPTNPAPICGPFIALGSSTCMTTAGCPQTQLCRTASECLPPFTQCVPYDVFLGNAGSPVVWGICQ